jgi:hypothetical protein
VVTTRALPAALPSVQADVVARTGICAALVGAAIIHGTVVSEHFQAWRPAGLFFLGTQLVEISLALAAVYAWRRLSAQLVFLTGVGTVAVWMLSRTFGMPFGPAAFRVPEAIGVPDLACCILELTAAALAVPLAFGLRLPSGGAGARSRTVALLMAGLLAMSVTAVSLWGLQPAVSGTPTHGHTTTR